MLVKRHIPVLLEEAIENLNIQDGDIIVDATLGSGGHSQKILEKLKNGRLIAIDFDQTAIAESKKILEPLAKKNNNQIIFIHNNFAHLKEILAELKIKKIDAILADLGWRIEQLESLSFKENVPLDMKLASGGLIKTENASQIINQWTPDKLAKIFLELGEERGVSEAVVAIIKARKEKEIKTNKELAEIIKKSIGKYYKNKKIHPATKIFQALRIFINGEKENLENFIQQAIDLLDKEGKLAIISYHSLEDRIIKEIFRANARGCICPKELPICVCHHSAKLKIITKKPIIASEDELKNNLKSRSAKLRVAEKK